MKICSSCIPYLCALDVPLRTCEASHGGKHCDSVGEDQTCYRSEFARAEGMVGAQQPVLFFCVRYTQASKLEISREKPSTGRCMNFSEQWQNMIFCMPEGATDHQASSGLSLLLRRYCLDLRTLELPKSDMSDWSRSNHVIFCTDDLRCCVLLMLPPMLAACFRSWLVCWAMLRCWTQGVELRGACCTLLQIFAVVLFICIYYLFFQIDTWDTCIMHY